MDDPFIIFFFRTLDSDPGIPSEEVITTSKTTTNTSTCTNY